MVYLLNGSWVATRLQWYSTHLHTHTHTHTHTIHRTTQNKQYIVQAKNFWKSGGRAPSLGVIIHTYIHTHSGDFIRPSNH